MKTSDFLQEHDACIEGAHWALSVSKDMADVWDSLVEQGKYDWLLWTATRPGVFPSAALRKLTCRFVRETPLADGGVVWDLLTDERSRHAVETAEAYADGKATDEELNSARSAAYDVYDDYASGAGAGAAAYAAGAAYDSVCAAYDAACAAAYDAADAAAWAAPAARAAYAARAAAYAAQIKMVAELGNPFRKGKDNENI